MCTVCRVVANRKPHVTQVTVCSDCSVFNHLQLGTDNVTQHMFLISAQQAKTRRFKQVTLFQKKAFSDRFSVFGCENLSDSEIIWSRKQRRYFVLRNYGTFSGEFKASTIMHYFLISNFSLAKFSEEQLSLILVLSWLDRRLILAVALSNQL